MKQVASREACGRDAKDIGCRSWIHVLRWLDVPERSQYPFMSHCVFEGVDSLLAGKTSETAARTFNSSGSGDEAFCLCLRSFGLRRCDDCSMITTHATHQTRVGLPSLLAGKVT